MAQRTDTKTIVVDETHREILARARASFGFSHSFLIRRLLEEFDAQVRQTGALPWDLPYQAGDKENDEEGPR